MVLCNSKVLFCVTAFLFLIKTAAAINCYQCSGTESNHPFQCNEFLDDNSLLPDSCENVYGAQYCIKHVGRFEAFGILCYQCSSNTTIDCGDGMIHLGGIHPKNCNHVFEAQYCIKSTGGIGTKRYCSPHDLGNYCDYVKQPGDQLEYRSCVYTCSGDACNSGVSLRPGSILSMLSIVVLLFYMAKSFTVR